MKQLYLLACAIIAMTLTSHAQLQVEQVIVVSSGVFESGATPVDYVEVGSYDPVNNTFSNFDVIYNQSAQALLIEDDYCYVGAADSIIKYDLTTLTRVGAAAFDSLQGYGAFYSLKNIAVDDNYVYVGAWYGASANAVQVFDKNTMSFVGGIAGLTRGVSDIVSYGDTLYVGQNSQGSNYNDTLGTLAIVDISTWNVVREEDFNSSDEVGRMAVSDAGVITTFNAGSSTINTFFTNNGTWTKDPFSGALGTSGYGTTLTTDGDFIYLPINGGLGNYDITSGNTMDLVSGVPYPPAYAFDYVNDMHYVSSTDYSTFGFTYMYDAQGNFIDTFSVGVAPENIAVHYRDVTSIAEAMEQSDLLAFPNPTANQINIIAPTNGTMNVQLTDLSGRVVREMQVVWVEGSPMTFDLSDLTNGIYMLNFTGEAGQYISRIIKQ